MYRAFIVVVCALAVLVSTGCSEESSTMGGTEQKTQQAASTSKPAAAGSSPKNAILERWLPKFDPANAEFTYLLSCIGHPDIDGVAVGFNIRDEVWKRTNGRLYVDYRPLAQLGGERDVISKLRMGAVQGMLSSSVAAVNLDNRLGLVNLPFVVDTYEKLETFRNDPQLFSTFDAPLRNKGIMVADFTGYGSYGWASRTPVKTVEEARKTNFRIAQAPVNTELYKSWGMKFTVMPWPDVPQALQTGVIDGLDHTPIVCSISRKFDNVKNFTFLNYAQGLYIHLINLSWLESLPQDIKQTLLEVINEESAKSRKATKEQEKREIEAAKQRGVKFWELADGERQKLENMAQPVVGQWSQRIGAGYLQEVKSKLNVR